MSTTEQLAPVVRLGANTADTGGRDAQRPSLIALVVAVALACSPLAFGYYSFTAWAPLGLGAVVLLVMLAFGPRARLSGFGRIAGGGLGLLLVLSFASIL